MASHGAERTPHNVPKVATVDAALIGAQRSGTTTLASLLSAHPQIAMAEGKEAHLFDQREVQEHGPSQEQLAQFFSHATDGQLRMDATPIYLYLDGCLEALHRHNPKMRIIAVLRDPAERARSHHQLEWERGLEQQSFASALRAESDRLKVDPDPFAPHSARRIASYADRGRYAGQIERCRSWFPDALFLRFDELLTAPATTLERICDHLGVDPEFSFPPLTQLNATGRHEGGSLAERWLRRRLRTDMTAAEQLLGWPNGSLRRARSSATRSRG